MNDPNYRDHLLSYASAYNGPTAEELQTARQNQRKMMMHYTVPEGMEITDVLIPGTEPDTTLKLRVFKRRPGMPVVMDIHGGGWVGGSLDIDNFRCISLAEKSGCTVVSVEYRLSSETVHFPAPLMDCLTAFLYLRQHGQELEVDGTRIAVHGTSAGGNLAAGLALYLRDKFHDYPALTILNCACVSMENYGDLSNYINAAYSCVGLNAPGRSNATVMYLGELNGRQPSYYAFPRYCTYFEGVGPHMIIAAEYDGLRDDTVDYGRKLLDAGVPCEMLVAPRVGHGFCTVNTELTDLVHSLIGYSIRREFGMLG